MSKIEWCDLTINPIVGCSKKSMGCLNCYAEKMAVRLKAMGQKKYEHVVDGNHWTGNIGVDDTVWNKLPSTPKKVFVCSMGDLFYDGVHSLTIFDVLKKIHEHNNHTFLILTKRPKRMKKYFDWYMGIFDKVIPDNLWLGVTCENQETAEERIPILIDIPAHTRFISVEPMLGPIDLKFSTAYIEWVICGAETGPGKRHMEIRWAYDLQEQCKTSSIPFFFKKDSKGEYPNVLTREFPK